MAKIKILFTVSRIYPYCDACGNCLMNTIQQMIKLNSAIEIFVLQVDYSFDKKSELSLFDDRVHIITIPAKIESKLSRFINKFPLLRYPTIHKNIVKGFKNGISSLIKQHSFSAIIDTYSPYDNVYCSTHSNDGVLRGLILFDSFFKIEINPNDSFLKKTAKKLCNQSAKKAEKRIAKKYSYVFSQSDMVNNLSVIKPIYFKFPLLRTIDVKKVPQRNVFTYAGSLYNNLRQPWHSISFLVDLIKNYKDFSDFTYEIYCNRDFAKRINDLKIDCVKAFDFLPRNQLDEKLSSSKYLVNIGNKNSPLLPSKLIDYLSFKKIILNFDDMSAKNGETARIINSLDNVITIDSEADVSYINDILTKKKNSVEINHIKLESVFGTGKDLAEEIINNILG